MTKLIICFTLIVSFILSGCIREWDRRLETRTIKYEFVKKTEYFCNKTIDLSLKEYKNTLTVKFKYDTPKDFPFPVDSSYNNRITETGFDFRFYYNNRLIGSDRTMSSVKIYRWERGWERDTSTLTFYGPQYDMERSYGTRLELPYYMFHEVPEGRQEIVMEIFQKGFYSEGYDEDEYYVYEKDTSIVTGKVRFEINMPEIRKTILYGGGFELQNDSEWSPVGMDFSFRKGLPDIYWTVYYPAKSEDDTRNLYCRSPEATYAYNYTYNDTFNIFHYEKDEGIRIGVYDRDDLSRDDFLGDWYGKMKELETDGSYLELEFDHVKSFLIKAETVGVIND